MATKALRSLFTANLNNEVVMFSTNLKEFVEQLKTLDQLAKPRNYDYYYREFKNAHTLPLMAGDNRCYTLQKVL